MGNIGSARNRSRRIDESGLPPYSVGDYKAPFAGGSRDVGMDIKEGRQSVESLTQEADDDALYMLKEYDIIFVIDDSTSMKNERWKRARKALADLADAVNTYTENGIDVVFLNSKTEGRNLKTSEEVGALFDSVEVTRGTPTGKRLDELLSEYTLRLQESRKTRNSFFRKMVMPNVRPVNYLIITDGVPSDDPLEVIVRNAKWLDENVFPLSQVGIQFVQIGRNSWAKTYLKKLDDDLTTEHGVRDMVDTFPYDQLKGVLNVGVLKSILLGGINRKEDRAH